MDNKETVDLSDDAIMQQLLRVKDRATIEFLQSYNVDLIDIYKYFYGKTLLCDLPYELQCAVFDNDPVGYLHLLDAYVIIKSAGHRVDKMLQFVPYGDGYRTESF